MMLIGRRIIWEWLGPWWVCICAFYSGGGRGRKLICVERCNWHCTLSATFCFRRMLRKTVHRYLGGIPSGKISLPNIWRRIRSRQCNVLDCHTRHAAAECNFRGSTWVLGLEIVLCCAVQLSKQGMFLLSDGSMNGSRSSVQECIIPISYQGEWVVMFPLNFAALSQF